MINRDVSNQIPGLTIQEYDETITREMNKLRRLRKDLFLVMFAFLAAGGACLYFDTPYLAGALFVVALIVNQTALVAALEVSMREANWSLALLIQRQSNDLLGIRPKMGAEDEEE